MKAVPIDSMIKTAYMKVVPITKATLRYQMKVIPCPNVQDDGCSNDKGDKSGLKASDEGFSDGDPRTQNESDYSIEVEY